MAHHRKGSGAFTGDGPTQLMAEAAQLRGMGLTFKEIGLKIGRHQKTVRRWCRDPRVRAIVVNTRTAAIDGLEDLVPLAIASLREGMRSPDVALSVKSAGLVLTSLARLQGARATEQGADALGRIAAAVSPTELAKRREMMAARLLAEQAIDADD